MFFVMFADPELKKMVQQFDSRDVSRTVFGHTCPVFAHYYLDVTETREGRRVSRSIPHDIMFKVARRDNYRCQKCEKPVPDNENGVRPHHPAREGRPHDHREHREQAPGEPIGATDGVPILLAGHIG